jgi:putative effector of murein hydrolase LrgA (UPF0299 family)
LTLAEIVISILASNIAALLALLLTLRAEKVRWLVKVWMNRSLKTWSLTVTIYFLTLLSLSPVLRNWSILGPMILPLLLSTGFAMIVFGPIQDQLVRKEQRKKQRSLQTQ